MTKADFTPYRNGLLALRARLRGDMTQMEDNTLNQDHHTATHTSSDMEELGNDHFDQELTFSLLGNEKNVVDQIDKALKRIEDGSFGLCEECGLKIPASRLEAIPYAESCVRCAAKREKGHKP